jgi:hypothetical protein
MLPSSSWRISPNPADLATAKPIVHVMNLIRQKDGLGPCLENAKVKAAAIGSQQAGISNMPLIS